MSVREPRLIPATDTATITKLPRLRLTISFIFTHHVSPQGQGAPWLGAAMLQMAQ